MTPFSSVPFSFLPFSFHRRGPSFFFFLPDEPDEVLELETNGLALESNGVDDNEEALELEMNGSNAPKQSRRERREAAGASGAKQLASGATLSTEVNNSTPFVAQLASDTSSSEQLMSELEQAPEGWPLALGR